MKKILIFLFAAMYTVLNTLTCFGAAITTPKTEIAASSLSLEAEAAILIDASTGDILYNKNSTTRYYPASITKLMTVLLVLENCEPDETVTFSHDAVFSIEPGSSHIAIVPDEVLTVEQCLYGIMLQSANEVSNAVGEHIAGSMEAFSQMMTARAAELGCKNTNFVNANGLHDDNHYTTAYDMALIAKEVLKYPCFREIMSSVYYEVQPTNMQSEIRYLHGQNQLLKPASIFYYEYCIGGKTGFTDQARNTLVAFAEKDGTTLISVVLKSTGYGEYYDTIALFDYGFENFRTAKLAVANAPMGSIDVVSGEGDDFEVLDTVDVAMERDVFATLPAEYATTDIESSISLNNATTEILKTGDLVGTVSYTLNGEEIAVAPIMAKEDTFIPEEEKVVPEIKEPVNFKLVFAILFGIVFVLFAAMIIHIKIEQERRRRRRARRRAQRMAMKKAEEERYNRYR